MVTNKVIETIYKKYRKRPTSPDQLDLPVLFQESIDPHELFIDGDELIINSIDPSSPFHSIRLDRVHAILEFENVVAIVLHSSIIFLGKNDRSVHVHVKMDQPSLIDRVKMKLAL